MFLLASALTNLSTSPSVRDTNLSLAEFFAVVVVVVFFFWCIARGHRKLLVVISFFPSEPSEQRIDGQAVVKSGAKEAA